MLVLCRGLVDVSNGTKTSHRGEDKKEARDERRTDLKGQDGNQFEELK